MIIIIETKGLNHIQGVPEFNNQTSSIHISYGCNETKNII